MSDLCYGKSVDLMELYHEVFSYEFKEKPNYNGIRTILYDLREQKKVLD